jgi:hypothetical protein
MKRILKKPPASAGTIADRRDSLIHFARSFFAAVSDSSVDALDAMSDASTNK